MPPRNSIVFISSHTVIGAQFTFIENVVNKNIGVSILNGHCCRLLVRDVREQG